MSVFNPGMSVCKIKTYFHWEKRSNFYRLLIAFFNSKNIFPVTLVTSFTHGFHCVQQIWSVASCFAVQTSLLNDFSVHSDFLSAAKLSFQDLLSSSSGHHLQSHRTFQVSRDLVSSTSVLWILQTVQLLFPGGAAEVQLRTRSWGLWALDAGDAECCRWTHPAAAG